MKITKRELKRVIRESLMHEAVAEDEFIEALRKTWDMVRMDVAISNPTWEDKADEVGAMLHTYEPDVAKKFNALPFEEQDSMFRLAFS